MEGCIGLAGKAPVHASARVIMTQACNPVALARGRHSHLTTFSILNTYIQVLCFHFSCYHDFNEIQCPLKGQLIVRVDIETSTNESHHIEMK